MSPHHGKRLIQTTFPVVSRYPPHPVAPSSQSSIRSSTENSTTQTLIQYLSDAHTTQRPFRMQPAAHIFLATPLPAIPLPTSVFSITAKTTLSASLSSRVHLMVQNLLPSKNPPAITYLPPPRPLTLIPSRPPASPSPQEQQITPPHLLHSLTEGLGKSPETMPSLSSSRNSTAASLPWSQKYSARIPTITPRTPAFSCMLVLAKCPMKSSNSKSGSS